VSVTLAAPALTAPPAGVPEKYSLLYEQDVTTEAGMKDFTFTTRRRGSSPRTG
jgi:hypothetical protein